MSLTLSAAPSVEPVTAAEVWAHLRLNLTGSPAAPADATAVAAITTAAVNYLDARDGILGRCLVTQTWILTLDRFPTSRTRQTGYEGITAGNDAIIVPLPPLQSVSSISYIDTDGATQTLSSSLYTVDTTQQPGRIVPAYGEAWPATRDQINSVTITFVAGYSPTSDSPADYRANVPRAIKQAIMLLIGHWYEHREDVAVGVSVQPMVAAADALLAPYRIYEFG
jgi:uncharacterized phiE125 gp8 family phage protein